MSLTDITTAAQKYRSTQGQHYHSGKEIWTKSIPWIELDEHLIDPDDAPRPCPESIITKERVMDAIYVKRQGVAVVIPSPGISKEVNARAARFWRRHGFELRTWWNCEDIQHSYIKEWVRMCDLPIRVGGKSKRYSARAWLNWANREYERLYRGS